MPEHDAAGDPPGLVPSTALGSLRREELLMALAPLWEDSGPLADALAGVQVASWDEHLERAKEAIAELGDRERAALLAAHPRIGTDPVALRRRSAASHREQGGDETPDAGVSARLVELNEAYEARFGFPFVEFVAGRSRAEMVPVIEARLRRGRAEELASGTAALAAIAADRLARLRSAPR